MNNGIFSEPAVDTLLGYAYMQPGVRKVQLKIDLDEKNDGKAPSIIYTVRLSFWKSVKRKAVQSFYVKKGLFNKLVALGLVSILRAPRPEALENNVKRIAKNFLPENYSVIVNVE